MLTPADQGIQAARCEQDAHNPQFLYSFTNTTLLLGIVNHTIDPHALAVKELICRGVGLHGEWIGFERAKEVWEDK